MKFLFFMIFHENRRVDLLIYDWDLRLGFALLDHRYSNSLPTILSTERSFPELVRLDEAIAGRLKERRGRYLINITPEPGKNFRFGGACPLEGFNLYCRWAQRESARYRPDPDHPGSSSAYAPHSFRSSMEGCNSKRRGSERTR